MSEGWAKDPPAKNGSFAKNKRHIWGASLQKSKAKPDQNPLPEDAPPTMGAANRPKWYNLFTMKHEVKFQATAFATLATSAARILGLLYDASRAMA